MQEGAGNRVYLACTPATYNNSAVLEHRWRRTDLVVELPGTPPLPKPMRNAKPASTSG